MSTQPYTIEELTQMLVSRKTPPRPVTILRESVKVDALIGEDPLIYEEVPTPFFVRVMSIPERAKVQAALDQARNANQAEASCLTTVVRLCACNHEGQRLFNDQWQGVGEADETILAIFEAALVANGFRRQRIITKKLADGSIGTETKTDPSPVDVIGKNS